MDGGNVNITTTQGEHRRFYYRGLSDSPASSFWHSKNSLLGQVHGLINLNKCAKLYESSAFSLDFVFTIASNNLSSSRPSSGSPPTIFSWYCSCTNTSTSILVLARNARKMACTSDGAVVAANASWISMGSGTMQMRVLSVIRRALCPPWSWLFTLVSGPLTRMTKCFLASVAQLYKEKRRVGQNNREFKCYCFGV